MLRIIVCFIIIVPDISEGVIVLTGGIVAVFPCLPFRERKSVPGNPRMLVTEEPGKADDIPLPDKAHNSECALHIRLCIPDISVRKGL